MTISTQYLEAAKVEELERQLKSEGYTILKDMPSTPHEVSYDLVAEKDGKRIAIEVKARSALREDTTFVRNLREYALSQGYDEFRLVIVNPPREKMIEIEGIERILFNHFIEKIPLELDDIASVVIIDDVSGVDIESIHIHSGQTHVRGSGTIDVTLEYGGGQERDGLSIETSFPFTFSITLSNDDMSIEKSDISLDVSDFHE